jgi:hypothetical protein
MASLALWGWAPGADAGAANTAWQSYSDRAFLPLVFMITETNQTRGVGDYWYG